jgi:hypothetical protein
MIEEPSGTDLPLAAKGAFAPKAEQLLAIEDRMRRPFRIYITHGNVSLLQRRSLAPPKTRST